MGFDNKAAGMWRVMVMWACMLIFCWAAAEQVPEWQARCGPPGEVGPHAALSAEQKAARVDRRAVALSIMKARQFPGGLHSTGCLSLHKFCTGRDA